MCPFLRFSSAFILPEGNFHQKVMFHSRFKDDVIWPAGGDSTAAADGWGGLPEDRGGWPHLPLPQVALLNTLRLPAFQVISCSPGTQCQGNQLFAGNAVWLPILQVISCSLGTKCSYLLSRDKLFAGNAVWLSILQVINCSLGTQCCYLISRESTVRWEWCVTIYFPGNQLFTGNARLLPALQGINCSLGMMCDYLFSR